MTISILQAWTSNTGLAAASLAKSFVNVPTTGQLLLCYGACDSATTLSVPTDDIGDSVAWTLAKGPVNESNEAASLYLFWKQVGTPSGGGKTVTITPAATSTLEMGIAEYQSDVTAIFAVDGTPTSQINNTSADPAPGAITTTASGSLIIGIVMSTVATSAAGANYTKVLTITRFRNLYIEDQISSGAGSYNPGWTIASGFWSAMGVAISAVPPPQFARPDSDISNPGAWTATEGTDLWDELEEVSPDDATSFITVVAATPKVCDIGLSDVADPQVSTGHTLRCRVRLNGGVGNSLSIQLMHGADNAHQMTIGVNNNTWETFSETLGAAAADGITDYSNLSIKITANWATQTAGTYDVSWVEFEVPAVPPPAGFPTTGILDTFTGTNGTDLPVYSSSWGSISGVSTLEIQGNAAASLSNIGANYWNPTTFLNGEVYVTVSTKPVDGQNVLLFLRGKDVASSTTLDGYGVKLEAVAGTDTLSVFRIDNGTQTQLGSSVSQEISAGDSIGLKMMGSTLQMYYKPAAGSWAASGSVQSDTTYALAGNLVLWTNGISARMDNFGGGPILSPGDNAPTALSRGLNLQQMAADEDEGRFNELDVRNWFKRGDLIVPRRFGFA